jgi:hypothetical protein
MQDCSAIEFINHISMQCKYASWVWEKLDVLDYASRANSLHQLIQLRLHGPSWKACIAACILGLWKTRNEFLTDEQHAGQFYWSLLLMTSNYGPVDRRVWNPCCMFGRTSFQLCGFFSSPRFCQVCKSTPKPLPVTSNIYTSKIYMSFF